MRTKFLLFTTFLTFVFSYGQNEQCGTMENLKSMLEKDPSLKQKMLEIEKKSQDWIKQKGFGQKNYSQTYKNNIYSKSSQNTNSLCEYSNSYYTTINAPINFNEIVTPVDNCTFGGEYVTINNLKAGRTYRISTCGLDNFDTQMTIFVEGGEYEVAYNDDWCGSQSEIYFTPLETGNYDVLINEYNNCLGNFLCANLEVELWYVPRPVIDIPVVVHVIHNGEPIGVGTNISDEQIYSQIDVLNEDFRRLNDDIYSVPAAFRGVSADPLIQFCLAQQDPNGIITTGIDRRRSPTQSQYANFGYPADLRCLNKAIYEEIIKPSTIWDRDKYLNFWVGDLRQLPPFILGNPTDELGCDYQSETLGYAQFPGLNPKTDGVFIRYDVFGRVGNVKTPYNLGRTTTHEVGHWLNLKHIWGDEDACAEDDLVLDTPLQSVNSNEQIKNSFGCPNFPLTDNCSINYPGIMFMNYMDYGYHQCRNMYTYGQFLRTESTLFGERANLQISDGCTLGTTLGLNQNNFNNKLLVYPNPTNSKVFFDNSIYSFKNATIYNYLGQEVSKIEFKSFIKSQEVDLSILPKGVYVLKFENNKKYKSVKVVKQ
jgi:hypothetical protein